MKLPVNYVAQEKKGLSLRLKPTQSLQTPTLHSLNRHLPYVFPMVSLYQTH